MFGKATSSHTVSANKRLFRSSLSADCQSVFHLHTSFTRDLRKGMSFSQNSMPCTSPDLVAVPYLQKSMIRDKADGGRGDLLQKIDLELNNSVRKRNN